jgi:hypothetical protein
MRDLIEVIYEYGSRHGVEWRETRMGGFDPTPDSRRASA